MPAQKAAAANPSFCFEAVLVALTGVALICALVLCPGFAGASLAMTMGAASALP